MCQEFLQKAWDAKHRKDYAEAEANYLACLKCDPENAEALREQGLMYWGNFEKTVEAIALIEKSLALEDCADGHFFLAMVNQECDPAMSAAEFRKAIEAYELEGDATGLQGLAHCYYAELLAQEDKVIEAEEQFLQALRIDPENETIQRNNARFQKWLRENGKHPLASQDD